MSEYSSFASSLKESGKVVRDFPSRDPGSTVHVIAKTIGSISVELNGYLKCANTRERLSSKKVKKVSRLNIEISVQNFVNSFSVKAPSKAVISHKNVPSRKDGFLTGIIWDCTDANDQFNYANWGNTTTNSTYLYLRNFVAPKIDEIGIENITDSDMDTIFNELTEHAINNGRTKLNTDGSRNAKNRDIARHGVSERLRRAGIMYDWIRENHPEFNLPEIRFPVAEYSHVIREEQPKYLPDGARNKLARIIIERCKQSEPFAFGAALEFFNGLRVAEASAPLTGELEILQDGALKFGRYFVNYQIVDGKRDEYLKRDPSYRYVPLTGIMIAIIKMRIQQLEAAGFTEKQIRSMPFVSWDPKAKKFIKPSDLSAYILKLLKEAGCDQAFLEKAEEDMRLHPEIVKGKPVYDLSAHILRRDFASRAFGHVRAADLDAIIGHANRETEHRDFASFDTMRRLAFAIEKCYTFESEYTQNPAAQVICVDEASEFVLSGSSRYTFVNTGNTDLIIRGHIRTCEAASDLTIRQSANSTPGLLHPHYPVDIPASRKERLMCSMMPELHGSEEI